MRLSRGIVVGLLALTACKVGPDYEPPQIETPDAWTEEIRNGVHQGPVDLKEWWTRFNDPMLTDLIERTDSGNLDLGIAMARIRESRAALGIARGERMPTVDATGSETGRSDDSRSSRPLSSAIVRYGRADSYSAQLGHGRAPGRTGDVSSDD